LDGCDAALIDLADADFFSEGLNLGLGRLRTRGIQVADIDRSVIVDIDLGARGFLNPLDSLAAGTDQEANLFRVDVNGEKPRSMRANGGARLAQGAQHQFQNLAPGFSRLFERGPDDFFVDAIDLEIELNAGDAPARAGDLEVHVAEVVLVAHDV